MANKTTAGKQWGPNGANANDAPDWGYVADGVNTPNSKVDSAGATRNPDHDLTDNASANVVSTVKGWELDYVDTAAGNPNSPVGMKEILVAMGGLTMPPLTVLFTQNMTDGTSHLGTGNLVVRLQMSSGVDVRTANLANVYIQAIGGGLGTANANLAYDASKSQPESGVLVFDLINTSLTGYGVGNTLTINSSSAFNGSANVVSRKKKGPTQNVVSTSLAAMTGANAAVITIT
jgi:hypothetical protein